MRLIKAVLLFTRHDTIYNGVIMQYAKGRIKSETDCQAIFTEVNVTGFGAVLGVTHNQHKRQLNGGGVRLDAKGQVTGHGVLARAHPSGIALQVSREQGTHGLFMTVKRLQVGSLAFNVTS